ncbi:MAG: lipopolysaccharide biosynthesis protein [Clostridia bacterium]
MNIKQIVSGENKLSDRKQLAINMAATLLCFVINLGINFLLAPYLTKTLGTEAYGFVSLANNFVNYATILTIALNSMASRFITIEIHKNNEKEANSYFNSVLIANIVIILVLIIPAICMIYYLENILNVPIEILKDVKLLFSLVFLNFFVTIIDSVYSISTFATNKLYLSSIKTIQSYIIRVGILIATFSCLKPSVFYVGLAALVSSIFILVVDIYFTKRLLPKIKVKREYFSFKKIKVLIASGIWNTITRLGQLLTDGLDLIICNLMISPTSMGQLAIVKTISTTFGSILSTVSSIFQPQLIKYYAKRQIRKLVESLKTSMKISGMFTNIPFAFIIVFGQAFYKLWQPTEDSFLLYILTILTVQGVILSGVITPMYYIYTITNKIKLDAIFRVIIGIFNVMVVYLIIQTTSIGIYAVAGVSAITTLLFNFIFVPIYTAKCLRIKYTTFYPLIMRYIMTTVIMIGVFFVLKPIILINGWMSLIGACIAFGMLGLVMNFILLLNKNEKGELIHIVKSKLKLE